MDTTVLATSRIGRVATHKPSIARANKEGKFGVIDVVVEASA